MSDTKLCSECKLALLPGASRCSGCGASQSGRMLRGCGYLGCLALCLPVLFIVVTLLIGGLAR